MINESITTRKLSPQMPFVITIVVLIHVFRQIIICYHFYMVGASRLGHQVMLHQFSLSPQRPNILPNKPFDAGGSAKASSADCVFPCLNFGELREAR